MPTFVFDEVDAGVGGRAAVEVGAPPGRPWRGTPRSSWSPTSRRSRRFADRHLVVERSDDGHGHAQRRRTRSRATQRVRRARPDARPGSGTDAALEHARDLMARARSLARRGTMVADVHPSSCPQQPRPTTGAGRSGTRRPAHQGPHQAAAPRRHRGHRPRSTSTGSAPRRSSRAKPAAVVNAAPSISGRYPNLGPEILVAAGIPLLDDVGPDVMALKEGTELRLDGGDGAHRGRHRRRRRPCSTTRPSQAAMTQARAGLSVQLEAFAANTMDYLRRERELLLDGVGVPDITTVARRPARADRRARLPLQGGPRRAAALHPRVPPGADRRRRRRRRAPRGAATSPT